MDYRKLIEEVGEGSDTPFGPHEERAIISLALDEPEFFATAGRYITHSFFRLPEAQWVMGIIEDLFQKTGAVPTRNLVRDYAIKHLTVDDDYEAFLSVIDRHSDPREIPAIKESLVNWARNRAYGMLYDPEVIAAYERGDYQAVEQVMDNAKRITDVSTSGIFFFDNLDLIFTRNAEEKLTTGFNKLDDWLNEGGPTRGEVVCWMAPTGVGKSILLPHSGIGNLKRGYNVLHVTLELSKQKTALRYAGALTDIEVHKRFEPTERNKMVNKLEKAKATFKGKLRIEEFPPDEVSVDHLYQLIDQLKKTEGFSPDVLVIDYLELMISRHPDENKNDYTKQKAVSTQVRGLARNENLLIFTATQTNRESTDKKGGAPQGTGLITVNRAAESYGKMMPMDYVVTANQSMDEYNSDHPTLRLFVAKNRNGPKFKKLTIKVNYKSFKMEEVRPNRIR